MQALHICILLGYSALDFLAAKVSGVSFELFPLRLDDLADFCYKGTTHRRLLSDSALDFLCSIGSLVC
jgi:hypothetical protein